MAEKIEDGLETITNEVEETPLEKTARILIEQSVSLPPLESDKSLELINKAIKVNPNYSDAYVQKGKHTFIYGKFSHHKQRYEEAIKWFDKAIEVNSENKNALEAKNNMQKEKELYEAIKIKGFID